MLFHNFEQRRLRFGACSVDFVAQKQIAVHRAPVELELALLAHIHREARDIGRHGVGRELDALVIKIERAGQREREGGFAHARHIFKQHMSARINRHKRFLDYVALSKQRFTDFSHNSFRLFNDHLIVPP